MYHSGTGSPSLFVPVAYPLLYEGTPQIEPPKLLWSPYPTVVNVAKQKYLCFVLFCFCFFYLNKERNAVQTNCSERKRVEEKRRRRFIALVYRRTSRPALGSRTWTCRRVYRPRCRSRVGVPRCKNRSNHSWKKYHEWPYTFKMLIII